MVERIITIKIFHGYPFEEQRWVAVIHFWSNNPFQTLITDTVHSSYSDTVKSFTMTLFQIPNGVTVTDIDCIRLPILEQLTHVPTGCTDIVDLNCVRVAALVQASGDNQLVFSSVQNNSAHRALVKNVKF